MEFTNEKMVRPSNHKTTFDRPYPEMIRKKKQTSKVYPSPITKETTETKVVSQKDEFVELIKLIGCNKKALLEHPEVRKEATELFRILAKVAEEFQGKPKQNVVDNNNAAVLVPPPPLYEIQIQDSPSQGPSYEDDDDDLSI